MAELYFAYGSNMSSARLRARVSDACALGAAQLPGFDLVFDKPGRDGTAKANLRRVPGAVAHGVLWKVESQALVTLDGFEPGYTRTRHVVAATPHATGEAELEAWTYLHPGSDLEIAPAPDYLRHLVEGAREHALPAGMQRMLRDLLQAAQIR